MGAYRTDLKNGTTDSTIDWSGVLAEQQRWLRTIVYARLRDAEAVEEVLQEIALAVVRQTARPGDPAKIGPWLYRVAVRQTLLFRRRCGRRRKLIDRYGQAIPPDWQTPETDGPLAWLLSRERQRIVRQALDRLPPRDAQILLLKYTENWSYRQIAERLGASVSAIEARLHRARARLRNLLQKDEIVVPLSS